jgi:pyruvate dehydrogenase E1 component alpha subunit/2-oxoisovalerate dehydrogenase E1 component alpha subunit
MAKAESPTRGRELNIHFGDLDRGFIGQISHLGDMVPVMAGVALTFKVRKQPRVALAYVGDGAMSTGAFHEGINLAAVQRLPLVIICENNGWAYSTPSHKQTAVKQLADKAKAYGIPGVRADGNDVLACYEVTKQAVERARTGGGVTLIEFVTYRRKGHAEHDNQSYQPKEQIAEWERNDPVDRYVNTLKESGWSSKPELAAIDQRVQTELDAAVTLCENEPLPDVGTALEGVYANPAVMETEWYRRINA